MNFASAELPLVTIGIAVFNGNKFIAETLNSIAEQTYSNIEIVIVDDASTDLSFNICSEWIEQLVWPVKLIKNSKNLGLPATRNIILQNANGKYINFFDQDDIMMPKKIEEDVRVFEHQEGNVALIYSRVTLIDKNSDLTGEDYYDRIGFLGHPVKDYFTALVSMNFISAPTVMLRTDIIKITEGYDESLIFDDWDMWLRLAQQNLFVFSDSLNVFYRIHETSMMGNNKNCATLERNEANIKMLKKYLGKSERYDEAIHRKLRELSIYSFFIGNKKASQYLRDSLKNKFDFKVLLYFVISAAGIPHPSKLFFKN